MDMANENCDPENMRIATQTRQNALKLGAAREKQQNAKLNRGNQERKVFGVIQGNNVRSQNAVGKKQSQQSTNSSLADGERRFIKDESTSMELDASLGVPVAQKEPIGSAPLAMNENLSDESMEAEDAGASEVRPFVYYKDVTYVGDYLRYLRKMELDKLTARINQWYMKRQKDIDFAMRATLIDWLVELRDEFKLSKETLDLTVSILDRFLSVMSCSRDKLQLAGITAMFIAGKIEEVYPPSSHELVHLTDNTYTSRQLLKLETSMLKVLRHEVAAPTASTFLSIYLNSSSTVNRDEDPDSAQLMDQTDSDTFNQLELLSQYLSELTLLRGEIFLQFLPSEVAAAALYVAADTLDLDDWRRSVFRKTGLSASDTRLKNCIEHLHKELTLAPQLQWPAIRDRYSSEEHFSVAKIRPKTNIVVSEL